MRPSVNTGTPSRGSALVRLKSASRSSNIFGCAPAYIKDGLYARMSGNTNFTNLYGPATALLEKGATAHVSPYPMASKDFPRDLKGRFMGQ